MGELGVAWSVKWISRESNCVTYTFQVGGKSYMGAVLVGRLDHGTIRASVEARIREHLGKCAGILPASRGVASRRSS